MCESRSSTTSWPVRAWLTTDTRLPMVPEATKSPAALPRRARIALIEVVGRDPELLLREPASADVDLREAIGGVSARRVLLDELSELLQSLPRQALVLLHGLQLVVVAHGEPELDEIGDLVLGEEGQEPLELAHRLVELTLPVERLADQEAGPRRVRRVRVPLDDPPEILPRLVVPSIVQFGLTDLVQLLGRQDRCRRRLHPGAAARQEQQACHEDARECGKEPHRNWPIHIAHSVRENLLPVAPPRRASRYPRPGLRGKMWAVHEA